MEDTTALRHLLAEGLAKHGFAVRESADAVEAEAALDAVDALVTDVHLGATSGLDLASRARARRPGLPVVVVSGDSGARAAAERLGMTFLAKPLQVDTLARTLADELASVTRRGPGVT